MKINIKATELELTPALKEFIDNKVGDLERFIGTLGSSDTVEVFVEVARTTNHHNKGDVFSAEIQIAVPGAEGIVVKTEEWDIHRAINKARDEMKGRLKSYKEKKKTKFFDSATAWKRISRIDPLARFRGEK
ncbi:MAG: ribosome-associated translation inhibitor RaiA [Candidatus Spechtbacterales bacterium]